MSAARRALWCAVLLAWPVVVAVKAIWSPRWGGDLSDGGAGFAFLLGAGLLRTGPPLSSLDGKRAQKQIDGLAARMDAVETGLAETQAQRASGIEGIRRALDNAGVPVPDCVSADAPTQPVLRAIGRRAV